MGEKSLIAYLSFFIRIGSRLLVRTAIHLKPIYSHCIWMSFSCYAYSSGNLACCANEGVMELIPMLQLVGWFHGSIILGRFSLSLRGLFLCGKK